VIIKVELKDHGVKDMLARLQERMGNMTSFMKEVGELVRSSVIKNFMKGGRPEKWKPHALATILGGISKKKFTQRGGLKTGSSRKLAGGKVLIDTARLMNSVTSRARNDRVEIGTNVIYAAIHQLGGKAGRGRKVTIPARPFLAVQDEDWTEIKKTIERYLMGAQ
jgi:phage virion morphogenesis protein